MKYLLTFILISTLHFADAQEEDQKSFNFSYKTLLIGSILTAISFSVDEDVKEIFQKNKGETLNTVANIFNEAGSGYAVGIPISTYIFGYYSKDEKLAKASKVAIASAVVSASITFPLKYAVNRERPDGSNDDSFPSGHTAFAFSIFGSYARFYNEGITPYILYSVPVLTGLSRIYKNKHYLSDVVAGATIGLISIPIGQWLEENLSIRFGAQGYIKISKKEAGFSLKYNF